MHHPKRKLYQIGITGGIASGKSSLLKYLAKTQPRIYTINLDYYGHAVYDLNPLILRNIATLFGPQALIHSTIIDRVNREHLGQIVFSDPNRLKVLRSLVSPEIKRLLHENIDEIESKWSDKYDIIAVEGAVLIEAGTYRMFDEMWVTTLDKEEAVGRVVKRNPQLTLKQARDRVDAQIDDEERLKYAQFHYQTGDSAPFEENVRIIEEKLKELRDRGILQKESK